MDFSQLSFPFDDPMFYVIIGANILM